MSDTSEGSIEAHDFDRFLARTIVTGKLVAITQIHVGSGEESPDIDNTLIRVNMEGEEVPYIPGSSIKGVIRAMLERALDGLDNKDEVISYIFGTANPKNSVQGHACFSDAIPVGKVATHSKPGVAIDSVTGAAKHGHYYRIETISPSTKFNFKLVLENIDLRENTIVSKALRLVLSELKKGNVSVGGKTSSGLGVVELRDINIETLTHEAVRDLDFEYRDVTDEVEL